MAEINPETARELGIQDRTPVTVITTCGSVEAIAQYFDIYPGAVAIPYGFPGKGNANLLTDDTQLDPVCGIPAFRSLPCRVESL